MMPAMLQPVGFPLPNWRPPALPPREPLEGRFCRVEPLDPERHAASLYEANSQDREGRIWTYLAYGPFASFESYRAWAENASRSTDPLFHAIVDRGTGRAAGVASYLRMDPPAGSIEV